MTTSLTLTGAEAIRGNLRKFRRTRVRYHVGRPFVLKGQNHPDRKERGELTEAMMTELASLLPESMQSAQKLARAKQLIKFT